MEEQQAEKIAKKITPKIRGKFNKDLLLNSFFEHTELFSPAAKIKLETGKYTNEVYGSKKYNIFWEREIERCTYGYENPITKVHISPILYFHLNYKQLPIIQKLGQRRSRRITTFPRFWPIHHFFLKDYETAVNNGFNLCVLKPRGTGWSELMSTVAAWYYTFQTEDPVFFFAANDAFLVKSGILSKAWDNLNFLNSETERAFKHLRQQKDQNYHKIASYWDRDKQNFVRTGGEIIGRVVDKPDKVRGARGYVFFEEGGSFPKLISSWMTCWALVEQGGTSFANMVVWGTGGEQGPGIQGLEEIFSNPEPYNCLPFDNCWDEAPSDRDHGFFFPVWAVMDRFMDKWGNTDYKKAYDYQMEQRQIKMKRSPHLYDKYIAEYPMTYQEALMRLANNPFPVSELQAQLRKVDSSQDIKGVLKTGENIIKDGNVTFRLRNDVMPIDRYPHNRELGVEGCLTVLESPLKLDDGRIPSGLYTIVADCFYVDTDQATEWESLGTFYVYKHKNNLFPTEDDMLVAWYSGRPATVKEFYRRLFLAARYYNAKVQTEIKGGGQGALDYAKENGLIEYCGERPSIFYKDKDFNKTSVRQYFIRMEEDDKRRYLQMLADWLRNERALKVEGDKTRYVLNLDKIYDRALLEELIKFNYEGNFDRISSLLVLMAVKQEMDAQIIEEQIRRNPDSIFSRSLFTDNDSRRRDIIPARELIKTMKTDGLDLII